MSVILDYDLVGRVFMKKINGDFDHWEVVDYMGENAYLVNGKVHGYKLVIEDHLRTTE